MLVLDKGDQAIEQLTAFAKRDGSAFGGHLLGGRVWPTLELASETHLPLISLDPEEETP